VIDVAPYDSTWPAAFDVERSRLSAAFGDLALRIEHHGSTAVPGLAAKPIIDIQVSVTAVRPLNPFIKVLSPLGYVHVPHPDDERCPFFHRPARWPHTHHLHLVAAGSDEERGTLAFRDYLRQHPESATEYEMLKRELAAVHDGDSFASREAYAAGKTGFVTRITALAMRRRNA
jgi:GrpB-like predicted nucleotidyltransferase (UPF0157 family)